ncbi:MAG TPA: RICIN domain-containing protein [Actinospica sp.]|nr:RICIN domain-containing protein [Actinospica sp.]
MSFKKRACVLGVSAAAAAVLISIPATAGAASAATAVEYGASSAAVALPSVQENASGTGLVLVPVPGVARTTKVYNGLTATSSTARTVPDSDGSHPAVRGKATVSPATEPTNYVETGPFSIYNKNNNACLDADSGTIGANGTTVQLWTCLNDTNQHWYEDNYGTYARIWNEDGGRYLDADLDTIGANGTKVQLWDFIDGNTNQWWYVNGDGTITNQDAKAGIHTYLDADLDTIAHDGTKIQLWQFAGGTNQYWY